jgi:hypothetical protein
MNRERSSVILQKGTIKDQSALQLKTVSNQNIYSASTYIEEINDNKKDLQRLVDRMY